MQCILSHIRSCVSVSVLTIAKYSDILSSASERFRPRFSSPAGGALLEPLYELCRELPSEMTGTPSSVIARDSFHSPAWWEHPCRQSMICPSQAFRTSFHFFTSQRCEPCLTTPPVPWLVEENLVVSNGLPASLLRTSRLGKNSDERCLRAGGAVLKRLDRCFRTLYPNDVPVLVGVEWSRLLRGNASRQKLVAQRTLHDTVSHLLQRLAQHCRVQPARDLVGDSYSLDLLSATEFGPRTLEQISFPRLFVNTAVQTLPQKNGVVGNKKARVLQVKVVSKSGRNVHLL